MLPSRSAVARPAVLLVLLLGAAAVLVNGPAPRAASAMVVAVRGSAVGYSGETRLFGGPPHQHGPEPQVVLPPDGGAMTASTPSGSAQHGPAVFFSSGPIHVGTTGTPGPSGSVTSQTDIQGINASGGEPFTAARAASTCTATEAGVSGSTTINGGTLRTSEGNPNVSGDEVVISIPTSPAPNTVYDGQQQSTGDTFRYIFNEQVQEPDGSLVVRAGHLYLHGPNAVGEITIGESRCGVFVTSSTTTSSSTSTTVPPTTTSSSTTTTFAPTTTSSSTTTTFAPTTTSSTTTTTFAPTTTTTVPATTTTTVPATTTTTVPATTTTTVPATTTTTTPVPRADVIVEKSAPATVRHNDAMTYRIVVRNAGPDTAQDVLLTDFLPHGTRYTAVTRSQGSCTPPHQRVSRVVCELGNLGTGRTAEVTLTVRVTAPHSQGHVNNVVQVGNVVPDPDHDNNEDAVVTTVSK